MTFARHKFTWLDQVLADPELSDFAIRLALVLMTYINTRSGEAWPSQETLIARCRASRSAVQNALYRLRDRGHILVEVVGGRTHTNRYRMNLKITLPELPLSDSENANRDSLFNDEKGPPPWAFSDTKGPSYEAERAFLRSRKGLPTKAQNLVMNSKKNTYAKKASSEAKRVSRKTDISPEAFETFWKAYPVDAGMSKLEASKAWAKLSDDDRVTAVNCVPGFKAWIAKQGKDYRILHACRYLSQKRFEGVKAAAAPETWDHAKYKAVIPLVKQRRAWSPAYPPPSTIPRDLLDDELCAIIGGKA